MRKRNSSGPRTGFNPLSGARAYGRSQNQPRPPVLTDQARTSVGAQKQILQTPAPFSKRMGGAQAPTGRIDNKKIGDFFERARPVNAQPQSIGKRAGVANTSLSASEMAAIGYGPKDTRSSNPIISGFPTRNQSRRTGPDSQPVHTGGNGMNYRRTSGSVPATETGAVRGDYKGNRSYTDPTGNRFLNGPMRNDGVKAGSHARGSATAGRSNTRGEAPFYGQR